MPVLSFILSGAALAAARPDADPPQTKSACTLQSPAPAIVVEGPPALRWTIAPDPHLARRFAPPPYQLRRGIVIRF
jgi:hypothetical protein